MGWLLATTTTNIPFQNSDTEKGNKQQTQKTEARELFCIEQENPSFCCQFINNFVAVCEPFVVLVVVFAVVVVFVSLVLCIEEQKEVEVDVNCVVIMQVSQLLLEEPMRLASILESSSTQGFSALTKIIGTLGPKSRSVETIEAMLNAGMTVARFDFSWGDEDYHQETLENLKKAVKNTRRLCAVMLDTVGPELYVVNEKGTPIELVEGEQVILTPDKNKQASSKVLPVNYDSLAAAVKPGDTIFIGQYLFTGSEETSVWLEVTETQGPDVICKVKNTATLTGTPSSVSFLPCLVHCTGMYSLTTVFYNLTMAKTRTSTALFRQVSAKRPLHVCEWYDQCSVPSFSG